MPGILLTCTEGIRALKPFITHARGMWVLAVRAVYMDAHLEVHLSKQ